MAMKIKKFTAANMQDALQQIKEVLGPEAVILHVEEKKDRRGRPLGVEVTAAMDEEPVPVLQNPFATPREAFAGRRQKRLDLLVDGSSPAPEPQRSEYAYRPPRQQTAAFSSQELERLKEQLAALTRLLGRMGHPELPPELMDVYARLIESGVSRQLAAEILHQVELQARGREGGDRRAILREVRHVIEQILLRAKRAESRQSSGRVKVLVGPTGVGKTTSIAKLAAADKIFRGLRVGLVSLDTYRIAAIEQLRTYAKISRLPLEIVYTPDEMDGALKELSGCDVIYVDTPGRSQKNGDGLEEIGRNIARIPDAEVDLVLSLTSKMEDLAEIWESFSFLPIRRLLFTKLDETNTAGILLDVVQMAQRPISFIANGQNVPDDIFEADALWIAQTIVGEKAA